MSAIVAAYVFKELIVSIVFVCAGDVHLFLEIARQNGKCVFFTADAADSILSCVFHSADDVRI